MQESGDHHSALNNVLTIVTAFHKEMDHDFVVLAAFALAVKIKLMRRCCVWAVQKLVSSMPDTQAVCCNAADRHAGWVVVTPATFKS